MIIAGMTGGNITIDDYDLQLFPLSSFTPSCRFLGRSIHKHKVMFYGFEDSIWK